MKYLLTIGLLSVFTMTFAQKYSNEFLNIGVSAAAFAGVIAFHKVEARAMDTV